MTRSRLWDRGDEPLDQRIARFTVGRDPQHDLELVAWDAVASAAHATMLQRIGVLSEEELQQLLSELRVIADEGRRGCFPITLDDEDGHTAIENRLTERLGDAGRRIHTGRSRNDQVIAALRLWGRARLVELIEQLLTVVDHLLRLADAERETTIAGYTHTRQAMPSTLGFHFAAHAEGLLDAIPWLQTAWGHLDRSPLGAASGYGVALPLDRQLVADLLGFSCVQGNTLAVQNDRGRAEFLLLGALLGPVNDLGRLSGDLIWYSSDELGFITLATSVTTGSSIMPQKRNPDVLELVRATAARLRARQGEIGGVYAALTSGYHRDLQLTKEPFVEAMQSCGDLFAVMVPVLENLRVDRRRCREALQRATCATDEVYRRVAGGKPFREAYREVAADPSGGIDVTMVDGWKHRVHLGAPGALSLDGYHDRVASARRWLDARRQKVQQAWALLENA